MKRLCAEQYNLIAGLIIIFLTENILLTELCVVLMVSLPGSPQPKQGDQFRFASHHNPEDGDKDHSRLNQKCCNFVVTGLQAPGCNKTLYMPVHGWSPFTGLDSKCGVLMSNICESGSSVFTFSSALRSAERETTGPVTSSTTTTCQLLPGQTRHCLP